MRPRLQADEGEHGERDRGHEEQQSPPQTKRRRVASAGCDEKRRPADQARQRHRWQLPVPVDARVDEEGDVASRGRGEQRVAPPAQDEER